MPCSLVATSRIIYSGAVLQKTRGLSPYPATYLGKLELSTMANNQQQQGNNVNGRPDFSDFSAMEMNIRRIPSVFLRQMKLEAGISVDRVFGSLSIEEKTRLNEVFMRTINYYAGTPSGAPRNESVVNASSRGVNEQPSGTKLTNVTNIYLETAMRLEP
ncbi:hypothetical protein JB92DRAFT_3146302 [Gautieria morchelliformis]|nr:hypothetical protein JB92DRAFT_3146302 [Gautieria morchelliformis]